MKKLVVLSGGLVAAGSAALIGAGVALSQPGPSETGSLNVIGEQYQKALQILKSQGVKAYFGGRSGACCHRRSAWSISRRSPRAAGCC